MLRHEGALWQEHAANRIIKSVISVRTVLPLLLLLSFELWSLAANLLGKVDTVRICCGYC